jgi:hypothetical protein
MGHGVLSMLIAAQLTEHIIGLAIEVHRCTGRGRLESVYEECLCYELHRAGIQFEHQVAVPVLYKGLTMEAGFPGGRRRGSPGHPRNKVRRVPPASTRSSVAYLFADESDPGRLVVLLQHIQAHRQSSPPRCLSDPPRPTVVLARPPC